MVRKSYSDAERKEHRDARLSAAHSQFQAGVAELLADDGAWQRYLTVQSKMHTYSFHNTLLILSQNENASMVAGFRKWQELGRNVRKGEKAIWILAPFSGKRHDEDPTTGEDVEHRFTYFKPVSVFDVSQTEGDPIPEPPSPVLLEGDSPELVERYVAVQTILEADGWTVKRESPEGGSNGDTDPKKRLVRVREDVSDAQALKTLVHEQAHIVLAHVENMEAYRQHRGRQEAEAESTAFLVLSGIGIDTSDYSLPYVAGWSNGNAKIVIEVAERVSKVARELLDRLDWSES